MLDLGAGTGWVAKRLTEKGWDVSLADVLECNETDLPLTTYDGKRLPYRDKEFDTTLLVFVLHHALNQEEVLREAVRVTRRRLVIVEDTPRNLAERLIERLWDTVLSIEHGMFAPHSFRTVAGWGDLFRGLGLRLVSQEVLRPSLPFYYTKAVFVLDL